MYELNEKLSVARQRGCIYNHINKLTIKIYSNLSNINIDYRFRLSKTSPLYYHFFRKLACNHNYIQTHCNDLRNPFQIACPQWYSYNKPHILTRIHIQILVELFLYLYEYFIILQISIITCVQVQIILISRRI